MSENNRFEKQIGFILEIDRLKDIFRRSYVIESRRLENGAEHSWHITLMAFILFEYAPKEVQILRILKMLLIHDIVEIDAGDTYCYDQEARLDQEERERVAARRIFGLLPEDQRQEIWSLWEEFGAGQTLESQFAQAIDRLMPLLHNFYTLGKSWQEHNVTRDQVEKRMWPIKKVSSKLWIYAKDIIDKAEEQGYLAPAPHLTNQQKNPSPY